MTLTRPTVGLVEDSDEDYALFERVFSPLWNVRRWPTGEDALGAFRGHDPSLSTLSVLVVDLHLPGIGGLDVVRSVRTLPDGRSLPVCVLTTSRLEADRRNGLDLGVDAFLVKPGDAARLRELPGLLAQLASR